MKLLDTVKGSQGREYTIYVYDDPREGGSKLKLMIFKVLKPGDFKLVGEIQMEKEVSILRCFKLWTPMSDDCLIFEVINAHFNKWFKDGTQSIFLTLNLDYQVPCQQFSLEEAFDTYEMDWLCALLRVDEDWKLDIQQINYSDCKRIEWLRLAVVDNKIERTSTLEEWTNDQQVKFKAKLIESPKEDQIEQTLRVDLCVLKDGNKWNKVGVLKLNKHTGHSLLTLDEYFVIVDYQSEDCRFIDSVLKYYQNWIMHGSDAVYIKFNDMHDHAKRITNWADTVKATLMTKMMPGYGFECVGQLSDQNKLRGVTLELTEVRSSQSIDTFDEDVIDLTGEDDEIVTVKKQKAAV